MMRPIKTATSNLVYRGDGKDVADLPCERRGTPYGTAICSVWQPSDEERAAIAAGANIELDMASRSTFEWFGPWLVDYVLDEEREERGLDV